MTDGDPIPLPLSEPALGDRAETGNPVGAPLQVLARHSPPQFSKQSTQPASSANRRLRRIVPGSLFGLAALAAALTGLAVWLDALYPPVLDRYLDRSTMVLDAGGGVLRAFTAGDGAWRLPTTPQQVSPAYLAMLTAYEDRRFRRHIGVDPLAVLRAAGQWLAAGRPVSGASTLTMQVARLLEPRPRTLRSKLIEMARALQLEARFSKDEILAMYLTLAPFGGNLEGVRVAALAWFGKDPAGLTPGEAALLVALPQMPSRIRPDRDPAAARAARDKVLGRMVAAGVLSRAQAAEAVQQAVPAVRTALPFAAPHLALALAESGDAGAVYRTTLDGTLQRTVEALAARALPGLAPQANVAALVVSNRDRRVCAYLGSAAFFDAGRDGQVDLVRAVRSPGSALKPFIYGMGFEDLLIHPATIVTDAPARFGEYAPSNFDGTWHGEVSVREALQRSLNLPAVTLLDRIGPARLAARLRAAGTPLRLPGGPDAEPGLALALGGVGSTLYDLVTLYAGLANRGEVAPLRLLAEDPPGDPVRLLTPVAAWYVTEVLAGAPPPDMRLDPAVSRDGRRIAFKTGTSYGLRDAWAIGYDAAWTVGVWVGRPDGTPSPDRFGRLTAAPLVFQIFDLLPDPGAGVVPPPPAGVIAVPGNRTLPPHLRRFPPAGPGGTAARPAVAEAALGITFPVDGSAVELRRLAEAGGPGYDSLKLIATGGRRPLHWLIDGRPIAASPLRREAEWQPNGRGQVRITVVDANGATASAAVWLQ